MISVNNLFSSSQCGVLDEREVLSKSFFWWGWGKGGGGILSFINCIEMCIDRGKEF